MSAKRNVRISAPETGGGVAPDIVSSVTPGRVYDHAGLRASADAFAARARAHPPKASNGGREGCWDRLARCEPVTRIMSFAARRLIGTSRTACARRQAAPSIEMAS